MRKLLFFLLLPAMAFAQFGHGTSGGTTITQVREAIADSSLTRLDDADTLTTRGGRDLKVPGLLVTGPAKFESDITARGNMTLSTTPLTKITADSGRFMTGVTVDGGIRATGASTFGATASPMMIEADGDVGIGTTAPLADLSIVNSGGVQTGLHVVNSSVNKNRTTWAQASDSASIGLQVLGIGQPMLRMRALDGDSLSVWDDGSISYIKVKNTLNIDTKGSLTFLANSTTGMLIAADDVRIYRNLLRPLTTDYTTLGNTFYRFKELWFTDNGYIGGKGQTAALTIGQQAVMTEVTDSTMVLKVVNGEPIITLLDEAGNQGLYATGDQVGIGTTAPQAKLEVSGSTSEKLLNAKQSRTELITAQVDRDFSGAGNWTGTNWAVSGGTLLHTAGNTAAATLAYTNFTASSILSGYPYELTFTVSGMTTGTLTPKLGTYTEAAIAANGTYTIYINASAADVNLTFTPTSAFDGALDNISMKLVENAAYVKGGILYHSGIQSVGGNARGIGAVDLQTYRTAATQVASGNYSTLSGSNSTASGSNSTASGNNSTASGSYSVASGFNSVASGSFSVASGVNAIASGVSSVASGNNSTASGSFSVASGGNSMASHHGSKAHAAGRFAANGDAQLFEVVLRDTTQGVLADTLMLDGTDSGPVSTRKFVVSANQAMYFNGLLVAWVVTGADDNKGAAYEIEGMITRDGSNNTTLVWQSVITKYEHADLAALDVALTADDTNEALNIIVTGIAANTIRWVATIRATQVGG